MATIIATLVCLLPLGATSALPLIDLPHHIALSALLWDTAFGIGSAREFYVINSLPTPYWTIYLVLGPAIRLFGVYAGTKLVTGICIVLIPLSIMRLLLALGRSPYFGLLAFLAAWDFNLYFGWLNHVFGMSLAFFALAAFLEVKSLRAVWRVWPWGVFLAITHLLPFGFFGLMGLLATFLRSGSRRKAFVTYIAAVSPPVLVLVPWLIRSVAVRTTDPGFVFDSFSVKFNKLFYYSLGYGHATNLTRNIAMFAMVVLVLIPSIFWFIGRKIPGRFNRLAFVPLIAAAILYFALPMAVARPIEHWGTYPRFATPMVLGLLFLPNPIRTRAQKLALVPALMALIGLSTAIFTQFQAFDTKITPFYEVVSRIPRGAKVLPLCFANRFPMLVAPMGESLHGYIVGHSGAFDPYLFDQVALPIRRKIGTPPAPAGWGRYPPWLSMERHVYHYDYILVQGSGRSPVIEGRVLGKRVEKVFEGGIYRLYVVR